MSLAITGEIKRRYFRVSRSVGQSLHNDRPTWSISAYGHSVTAFSVCNSYMHSFRQRAWCVASYTASQIDDFNYTQ